MSELPPRNTEETAQCSYDRLTAKFPKPRALFIQGKSAFDREANLAIVACRAAWLQRILSSSQWSAEAIGIFRVTCTATKTTTPEKCRCYAEGLPSVFASPKDIDGFLGFDKLKSPELEKMQSYLRKCGAKDIPGSPPTAPATSSPEPAAPDAHALDPGEATSGQ